MQDNNEFELEFTGAQKHRQNSMQKNRTIHLLMIKEGCWLLLKQPNCVWERTMFLYVCSTLSYGVRYFRCTCVCVFALQWFSNNAFQSTNVGSSIHKFNLGSFFFSVISHFASRYLYKMCVFVPIYALYAIKISIFCAEIIVFVWTSLNYFHQTRATMDCFM